MTTPRLSVVVPTYNRASTVARLLEQLADQTLPPSEYEVVVVDDGSKVDPRPELAKLELPYRLTVERQANGGPGRARNKGVSLAKGEIVLFLDDDMQVPRVILEEHLRLHRGGDRNVVLGRMSAEVVPGEQRPLFIRFHAAILERQAHDGIEGAEFKATNVWTGNISMRRKLFDEIGGFDVSLEQAEDTELGIRLKKAGATFIVTDVGHSIHGSDHTSVEGWMKRAFDYGVHNSRIWRKHRDLPEVSPWRYLAIVNPLTKPFLVASVTAPKSSHALAKLVMKVAQAVDGLGLEKAAIAGCSVAWGMEHARGMRHAAGSLGNSAREYLTYVDLAGDERRKHGIVTRALRGIAGGAEGEGDQHTQHPSGS